MKDETSVGTMATGYLDDSCRAPREFNLSLTETQSDQYKKCLLCFNIKKHFYCKDCIASGDFVHSTSHFSERFSDKQLKLYRAISNRNHVKERCTKLLESTCRPATLSTDINRCKDKIQLLKQAIEQNKQNLILKQQNLNALKKYNGELTDKLPRYANRVMKLGRHAAAQKTGAQTALENITNKSKKLAALRKARIGQLMKFIFPVYISYRTEDSLDYQMDEMLRDDNVSEQCEKLKMMKLHIVHPWLRANGDYSEYTEWVAMHKDVGSGEGQHTNPVYRVSAALSLAVQLVSLLSAYLDARLPFSLNFSDYSSCSMTAGRLSCRSRRLCACVAALVAAAGRAPAVPPQAALLLLHGLHHTLEDNELAFGRGVPLTSEVAMVLEAWLAAWAIDSGPADDEDDEPEPPEHLSWPGWDNMEDAASSHAPASQSPALTHVLNPSSPAAASLVTSAAASIASIWRGWTAK